MSFMIMASVIFYARLPGNPKLLVNAILTGCFWLSGSQFLMTIIPMTYTFGDYNGLTSDGKKLLQLLSKE